MISWPAFNRTIFDFDNSFLPLFKIDSSYKCITLSLSRKRHDRMKGFITRIWTIIRVMLNDIFDGIRPNNVSEGFLINIICLAPRTWIYMSNDFVTQIFQESSIFDWLCTPHSALNFHWKIKRPLNHLSIKSTITYLTCFYALYCLSLNEMSYSASTIHWQHRPFYIMNKILVFPQTNQSYINFTSLIIIGESRSLDMNTSTIWSIIGANLHNMPTNWAQNKN